MTHSAHLDVAETAFSIFNGSRALFTRPASIFFSKNNFKTGFHNTIHTFKNHFATRFL